MRRQILFVLLATAGLAPIATAACTDTLFLQSITVLRQNLKNTAILSTWDSVKVNPWDSTELIKAAPLGNLRASNGPDTAIHYLRFQYDCGADSVSSVLAARVIDKMALSGEDYVHVRTSETFSKSHKVTMMNGEGAGIDIDLGNTTENWSIIWNSDVFQIGRKSTGQPRISFEQQATAYIYTPNSIQSRYMGSYTTSLPFLGLMNETVDEFLGMVDTNAKKVGSGVDSVRTQIVRFRYEYDRTAPASTSISPLAKSRQAFSVQHVAGSWNIELPSRATVGVYSTSGKLAKSFAPDTRIQWDGRDAAGSKVHPGLWLVRAEGIGSVPVLVR